MLGLDLPPGFKTHYVVLRLPNLVNNPNGNLLQLPIGQRLEHVVSVYLLEYNIRAPNGAAVTPSLWSLEFQGGELTPYNESNIGTGGFLLSIDNATVTHHEYNIPRLVSQCNRGYISNLNVKLTDPVTGLDVTYADATFYLAFVCKDVHWDPAVYMRDDRQTPNFPSRQFDSRAPF
jgi:hypothetical protein